MIKRQKLSHILHPSFTHDLLSPIYHQAPPCWAILKTPPGLPLWIGGRAGLGTNLHWIAIWANHAAAGLSPKVEPWNGETYSCGQKMRMGDPHASCCRCQLLPASYSTKGSSFPKRCYIAELVVWCSHTKLLFWWQVGVQLGCSGVFPMASMAWPLILKWNLLLAPQNGASINTTKLMNHGDWPLFNDNCKLGQWQM